MSGPMTFFQLWGFLAISSVVSAEGLEVWLQVSVLQPAEVPSRRTVANPGLSRPVCKLLHVETGE